MVVSSTLIPPTVETKPSSLSTIRKDSNASSSGAYSERSRSFGHEENSTDSLFTPSSHYLIKCNINTTNPSAKPRVKVTIQQPSITICSSSENLPSEHLKTPTSNTIPIMSTSTTSSAPEFSLSGASSIDDSDEATLYDRYLSSCARQSNPSPELRKKTFDDWLKLEQRYLPRSKSDLNTLPSEHLQEIHQSNPIIIKVSPISRHLFIAMLISLFFIRAHFIFTKSINRLHVSTSLEIQCFLFFFFFFFFFFFAFSLFLFLLLLSSNRAPP